jgi:hypothetical protein
LQQLKKVGKESRTPANFLSISKFGFKIRAAQGNFPVKTSPCPDVHVWPSDKPNLLMTIISGK